ncbi:MAG: hypothetical protein GY679_00855, partial [Mycoplasma sp.]|nr:hypothetical protein [Mycoplasma sp.]
RDVIYKWGKIASEPIPDAANSFSGWPRAYWWRFSTRFLKKHAEFAYISPCWPLLNSISIHPMKKHHSIELTGPSTVCPMAPHEPCSRRDSPSTNNGTYALDDEDSQVIFCSLSGIPISDFVELTSSDSDLQNVIRFHSNGWLAKSMIPTSICPYFESRLSLSVEGGLLLKGSCLCVPTELQNRTIELLHLGHPGITRMLQQYRLCYYWPGGTSSIKQFCEFCGPCHSSDAVRPQESVPTGAVPPPDTPWTELSLDITGPFASAPFNQRFIVVLQDYFSKYPVVLLMEKITTKVIVRW